MLESKNDPVEVISAGHPPVAAKTVLIDFDGTIRPFGKLYGYEPAFPGVPEAIQALKKAGYRVIIFTSRLSKAWHFSEGWGTREATKVQTEYITKVCKRNKIPFDGITAEKIPAEAIFDDKAIRVDNSYTLADGILDFIAGTQNGR